MIVVPAALPSGASRLVATEAVHAEECLRLAQFGWQVQEARRAEGLAQGQLAKAACLSVKTLRLIEKGDPGVQPASRHRVKALLHFPDTGDAEALLHGHRIQDLQSMLLHRAAVRLLLADPLLVHRALQTIHNWLSNSPASRTAPLWLQWQAFLEARASESGGRGSRRAWDQVFAVKWQQMRQASPLPGLLPPEVRAAVLEVVRNWKRGVMVR